MLAAIAVPEFVQANPSLVVAAVVVLVGLVGFGLKDVLRLSVVRLWAISNVCFTQALRRRVLLVTPVVMAGIVISSQFQRAIDPQDAIRQTTMFCLFAAGLVVSVLVIILACTNLPKEIENRVIYTIATKPTTRLEIIAGKVVGFARVSFCILAIMGVFTWSYLTIRDWQIRRSLAVQLATPGAVDQAIRATLERYRDDGTLHARELGVPQTLNMYSHVPTSPTDRWVPGNDGEMVVPFYLDLNELPPAPPTPATPVMGPVPPATGGVLVNVPLRVRPRPNYTPALPAASSTQPAPAKALPRVEFTFSNRSRETIITSRELGVGSWEVPAGGGTISVYLTQQLLARLLPANAPRGEILLSIVGTDEDSEYTTRTDWVNMYIREKDWTLRPSGEVRYMGRNGMYGQQLHPTSNPRSHVAVFEFRGQKLQAGRQSFNAELRVAVERLDDADASRLSVDFINRRTGKSSGNENLYVESNRPAFLTVPAAAVEGGDFDVVLHSLNASVIGIRGSGDHVSLTLVRNDESFAWNLFKSLTVLWLMSLLFIIVAVFASTFVSWPIAVVLTVVILCGRWGAEQVADMSNPGVGRQIVNDMMRNADAASAKAVETSVDALVAMLRTVAAVLPDISRYAAMQDIQQGVAISVSGVLLPSIEVTAVFGLPLLVLAYVFLKYKEVAP